MNLNDYTIILPTKNEAHNIGRFLSSLPGEINLVVIDSSKDDTPLLIRETRPQRTHILHCAGNVTQARQAGAGACSAPWLLFSDADVHFAPGYFERLERYQDWDMVYGAKLSKDAYRLYYQGIANGQQLLQRLGIPAVSGSNLLIRRAAFLDCGGFDLRLAVNEDSELGYRLSRKGWRVAFAKDLVVYAHDHRRLRRGAVRKTLHSWIRCSLLYLNLMPSAWRSRDWGYWKCKKGERLVPTTGDCTYGNHILY